MASLRKKSLGPIRFDDLEMTLSPNLSPSKRRRSIAAQNLIESNIEENDDEAERLARRERNDSGSPASAWVSGSGKRQSTFGLSAISNLSASEMSNQIAQCIKLSAENKINDKNAFQLKMIDFLVYTLKKQDPNMTNLQMASASLDASAKIYGFRVDKVHSDLLKIIGMGKQDKRDNWQDNRNGCDTDLIPGKTETQTRKKRKHRPHIICAPESLRGNTEIYDPSSLTRCQREAQTSDLLFQASLPQHEIQDIALNLFSDVVLDKIQSDHSPQLSVTPGIINEYDDYSICASYSAFKFLNWSPDTEEDESRSLMDEMEGDYHFDLDAVIPDENEDEHEIIMNWDDQYRGRCEQPTAFDRVESIIDFQDIIANNPNPDATYEYSYLQKSYRIHWAGPSHWKITLNKCGGGSRIVETCKQNAAKKKKEIDLSFLFHFKEETRNKFCKVNRQTRLTPKTTKSIWSEEKVTFPQQVLYDFKQFYIFFNKPLDNLKPEIDHQSRAYSDKDCSLPECDEESIDHGNVNNLDIGENNTETRIMSSQNVFLDQNHAAIHNQRAFVGDNLVSMPKLMDRIFIPYSQRAKKVDMRQLKRAIWKNLKMSPNNGDRDNTDDDLRMRDNDTGLVGQNTFSNVYSELPKILSKANIDSLSPAIAFVSILHIANEKNLEIKGNDELSDLIVSRTEMNSWI